MVMVRAFEPTGIFAYLATQMVRLAGGQGKRLLLGIVAITTPICAVLPNATTVMLLAPLLPPIAAELGVNFVPLLILLVLVANSAGLLTLVGDPATFIVGDAINISFLDYLKSLSLGGRDRGGGDRAAAAHPVSNDLAQTARQLSRTAPPPRQSPPHVGFRRHHCGPGAGPVRRW